MGKPTAKKKKPVPKASDFSPKSKPADHTVKAFDADATIFADISHEMKEEGKKLFQKRDYEGALLKYEKAVKLLPNTHADIPYLRSCIAQCYIQTGPSDYLRAIHECNLALDAAPKYTTALLKRAKCFEALNRLELAYKDVEYVLTLEPNNPTALEIADRVKPGIDVDAIKLVGKDFTFMPELAVAKEKAKKKKNRRKAVDELAVQEEKIHDVKDPHPAEELPPKVVKLVFGDDIRWAQIPADCSMLQLRGVLRNKLPNLRGALVKYKDREGDLVTITTAEELKWAEESADPQGSVRLYIFEVNPEQELFFEDVKTDGGKHESAKNQNSCSNNGTVNVDEGRDSGCIDDWILQFAQLFKNHVGCSSNDYLNVHQIGMKLYAEAIEDVVTSVEAQPIFQIAAEKFQEMAALALFNWGNIHMSRAQKRFIVSENSSSGLVVEQIKASYEYALDEYVNAGRRYEEAVKIKPDFFEGFVAQGQQKFEQAKLTWRFAMSNKADLMTPPKSEILELFNCAEDNMERGTEMYEEVEEFRLKGLSKPSKKNSVYEALTLNGLLKDLSSDETAEFASNTRSLINIMWGTILYERSIVEFKLGLPMWEECLMASVEKFKSAGASTTDVSVVIKNHCANATSQDGLGFKIDEIVRAWSEMYDAKKWMSSVSSSHLAQLFRRRVPNLHHVLEHV